MKCNEIWSFLYLKEKNVVPADKGILDYCDVYTCTAVKQRAILVKIYDDYGNAQKRYSPVPFLGTEKRTMAYAL